MTSERDGGGTTEMSAEKLIEEVCTCGVLCQDIGGYRCRYQRVMDAVEGECDGLAITREQARAIVDYALPAAATLSATQADNERLRKALEPFAAMLHRFETAARGFSVDPRPDSYVPRTDFTYGELRAAARALAARSALPEQEEGK